MELKPKIANIMLDKKKRWIDRKMYISCHVSLLSNIT